MLQPIKVWCVRCQRQFNAGTVPVKEETQVSSFLYGANDNQLLCLNCGENEEAIAEQKGTNYVPELLKQYAESSYIKPVESEFDD